MSWAEVQKTVERVSSPLMEGRKIIIPTQSYNILQAGSVTLDRINYSGTMHGAANMKSIKTVTQYLNTDGVEPLCYYCDSPVHVKRFITKLSLKSIAPTAKNNTMRLKFNGALTGTFPSNWRAGYFLYGITNLTAIIKILIDDVEYFSKQINFSSQDAAWNGAAPKFVAGFNQSWDTITQTNLDALSNKFLVPNTANPYGTTLSDTTSDIFTYVGDDIYAKESIKIKLVPISASMGCNLCGTTSNASAQSYSFDTGDTMTVSWDENSIITNNTGSTGFTEPETWAISSAANQKYYVAAGTFSFAPLGSTNYLPLNRLRQDADGCSGSVMVLDGVYKYA